MNIIKFVTVATIFRLVSLVFYSCDDNRLPSTWMKRLSIILCPNLSLSKATTLNTYEADLTLVNSTLPAVQFFLRFLPRWQVAE